MEAKAVGAMTQLNFNPKKPPSLLQWETDGQYWVASCGVTKQRFPGTFTLDESICITIHFANQAYPIMSEEFDNVARRVLLTRTPNLNTAEANTISVKYSYSA